MDRAGLATPELLPEPERTDDAPHGVPAQEIRLALVLTGGVSLAVWMGGVASELQRLARGDGHYRTLCELTGSRIVIDTVGGSSAGGINGAILAMALTHGTDASSVRDVWVERASLRDLLRDDREQNRTSLLRGDSYFLPQLQTVFGQLRGQPVHPSVQPMSLILTGTLLDGVEVRQADDFGSVFTDTTHRAEFRFQRGTNCATDDFADDRITGRLALAARATSSFPGAFEPTFCPVGSGGATDLAGHVNFPRSGFVIDGGVLVNKPLRPVLDAVIRRRDEPSVRRVIVYVQPSPDQPSPDELQSDPTETLPGFGRVLQAGLLTLPHAESLARELLELRDYNARVNRRAAGLHAQLEAEPYDLVLAAEHLLTEYRSLNPAGDTVDHFPHLPATPEEFAAWPWTAIELRHALDLVDALGAQGGRSGSDPAATVDHKIEIERLRYEIGRAEAAPGQASARWHDAMHTELAELALSLSPDRLGSGPAAHADCRRWLLAGAVVHGVAASGRVTGSVPIDLLHISAEAPSALDGRSRPEQKLAGLQMQHFGAFYRSAWRANDWMWGRLDGISRIVQMLLAPARLRELAAADPDFVPRATAVLEELAADTPGLPDGWRDELRRELAALSDPGEAPRHLPSTVMVVAATLQLGAAAEELPRIARQVAADEAAGHRLPAPSRTLLETATDPMAPEQVPAVLAACRLGEERLVDDVGSVAYEHFLDRLTRFCIGGRQRPARSWRARTASPPLLRALRHAATLSRWPLTLVAIALCAGAVLVVSATSAAAATTAAVAIGGLLVLLGAVLAALLARRIRPMLVAAAACLVICALLTMAGPWYWRGWLLVACALDLTLSARRAKRLRRGLPTGASLPPPVGAVGGA